jgi:hypothetical protein
VTNAEQTTTWLKIAKVFDRYTETTHGAFDPDHPQVTDPQEKARILRYLEDGRTVRAGRGRSYDQVDPRRGPAVRMIFVTDGEWIWSRAVDYYLRVHDLLPENSFLAHIIERGYQFPALSEEAVLSASDEFERIWPLRSIDGSVRLGPP